MSAFIKKGKWHVLFSENRYLLKLSFVGLGTAKAVGETAKYKVVKHEKGIERAAGVVDIANPVCHGQTCVLAAYR